MVFVIIYSVLIKVFGLICLFKIRLFYIMLNSGIKKVIVSVEVGLILLIKWKNRIYVIVVYSILSVIILSIILLFGIFLVGIIKISGSIIIFVVYILLCVLLKVDNFGVCLV